MYYFYERTKIKITSARQQKVSFPGDPVSPPNVGRLRLWKGVSEGATHADLGLTGVDCLIYVAASLCYTCQWKLA